jgi:glycosyltransferase involved in cell wall biosynthesis
MLDIVLRTCDRVDVHPERGRRFIDCDKSTLIKKCLISLLESIKRAKDITDIRLTVVDDNSSVQTIEYIEEKIKTYGVEYEVIRCEEQGFNYSAVKQFEVCRDKGREWVYCVEDDYLHFPNAIEQMIKTTKMLVEVTGTYVAIRPDDDVFTYSVNSPHSRRPCMVLMGEDRHWRTLHTAHNTIFTHVDVYKEYWELFHSLGKFFKVLSINEDKTINMIWEKVHLFSPLPTLATHVSQNNEPPFVDYMTLWNSIKI